jgi:hypothetical protein
MNNRIYDNRIYENENYLNKVLLIQEQVEQMIKQFDIEKAVLFCIGQLGEKLGSSHLYGILVREYHKYIPEKLWHMYKESILPPYQGNDKNCSINVQFINRFRLINYYRQITKKNNKIINK